MCLSIAVSSIYGQKSGVIFAIIGATKGLGLHVSKRALAKGHNVRALSRGGIMPFENKNLLSLCGNALNKPDITKTIAGCDVVVLTLGTKTIFKEVKVFSQATKVIVDAMAELGPKRLIVITGIGTGNSRKQAGILYGKIAQPLLLKKQYEDKERQEKTVKQSDLNWTIVRPHAMTYGKFSNKYKLVTDFSGLRPRFVSRADVAGAIVRIAEQDDFIRKVVVVTR